jgi:thioredoxin-like negative regulator of GroEL
MTRRFLTALAVCCSFGCVLTALQADPPAGKVEWRLEYEKARKEAESTNRPLLIDVGTENCYYCKQLDLRTFTDPTIVQMLSERVIPLKIDANAKPELADALHVQSYPTLVFATPDGRILDIQTGFIEAPGLQEKLNRTLAAMTAPPDWMTRFVADATKAMDGSDTSRAAILLLKVVEDGKDRPVQLEAKKLWQRLEEQAAGRNFRARELAEKGKVSEAVQTVAETVRLFPGTRAAKEGTELLVSFASGAPQSSGPAEQPVKAARKHPAAELLVQAQQDYSHKQFLSCLDRCETILAKHSDQPEADEAGKLASEIKSNPDLTRHAAEEMSERLGVLYLALADSWLRKGQPQQAVYYLERLVQTLPNSRHAEVAQVRLAQIQGAPIRLTERK